MYIATYLMNSIALIFLAVLIASSTAIHRHRKRPFICAIFLTIAIIGAEAGTVYVHIFGAQQRAFHIVFNILGFSLSPLIPIVLALIFDDAILKKHRMILVPTIINIVACLLSSVQDVIFFIDAHNTYVRGKYFYIFVIVYCVNFVFLVLCTGNVGYKHNYPMKRKLMALFLFTLIGTSVQILYPAIYLSWHSVTLALFLYFFIMSDFDTSFDTLTGLYNRSTFDKTSEEISQRPPYTVVILDINDFKRINDTYGHDYGDQVIKKVATIIRTVFHKPYTCFRYGGDEFAIVTTVIDEESLKQRLHEMTSTFEKQRTEGLVLPSVSYGYSIAPHGSAGAFKERLREADERMYQYKKACKTCKDDMA